MNLDAGRGLTLSPVVHFWKMGVFPKSVEAVPLETLVSALKSLWAPYNRRARLLTQQLPTRSQQLPLAQPPSQPFPSPDLHLSLDLAQDPDLSTVDDEPENDAPQPTPPYRSSPGPRG